MVARVEQRVDQRANELGVLGVQLQEPLIDRRGLTGTTGPEQGVRISAQPILTVGIAPLEFLEPFDRRVQFAQPDGIIGRTEENIRFEILVVQPGRRVWGHGRLCKGRLRNESQKNRCERTPQSATGSMHNLPLPIWRRIDADVVNVPCSGSLAAERFIGNSGHNRSSATRLIQYRPAVGIASSVLGMCGPSFPDASLLQQVLGVGGR